MTEKTVPKAHQAMLLASQGLIDGDEMLHQVVAGHWAVPLSEPPILDHGVLANWQPVATTKHDGSLWLIAFTTEELAFAFCNANREYGHFMTVEARWAIEKLPPEWGILFNVGSVYMLEWNAEGVAKYRNEVLGRETGKVIH